MHTTEICVSNRALLLHARPCNYMYPHGSACLRRICTPPTSASRAQHSSFAPTSAHTHPGLVEHLLHNKAILVAYARVHTRTRMPSGTFPHLPELTRSARPPWPLLVSHWSHSDTVAFGWHCTFSFATEGTQNVIMHRSHRSSAAAH